MARGENDFIHSVEKLLSDVDRASLGKQGNRFYNANFSKEVVIKKYFDEFLNLDNYGQ